MNNQMDLVTDSDALYRGITSMASEFYAWLPEDNKHQLPVIISIITGKDYTGKTINEAVQEMSLKQITEFQKLIEKEYKLTKH